MRIKENKDEVVSALNFNKTHVTINEPAKGTLGFWFKRSDFYITGMNFVFSRIALMC
jgi:Na+/melibiose symporter-like transporter